jgi:hypothetical protein
MLINGYRFRQPTQSFHPPRATSAPGAPATASGPISRQPSK